MQNEHLEALQTDCARYLRICALPEEQQAPYRDGIMKLERRIEDLRKACGLTLDRFVMEFAQDVMRARLEPEEASRVDIDRLWDYAEMAAEGWKRADVAAIQRAREGIQRTIYAAKGGASDERAG